jgi:hypothetical protein
MTKKKDDLIAHAVRLERCSVPEKPEAKVSPTAGVSKGKPSAKHPVDVRIHKVRQSSPEA